MPHVKLQAALVVATCLTPACGPDTAEDPVNVSTLCDSVAAGIDGAFEVDLSGRVSTRTMSTAIDCNAEDACCNYTWTAYVVECKDGDIVLSAEGEPYGSETVSAEGIDDDFGPVEVTLGCQGAECEPTCVPGDDGRFGRVKARLEPAADGFVSPGEGFESFEALAALVIEARLAE